MNGKKDAEYSQLKQVGALTTIPIVLLTGPAIGYFLGGWIDRKTHLYPWFTITFVFLGFIAAAREMVRLLKQVLKEDSQAKKNP